MPRDALHVTPRSARGGVHMRAQLQAHDRRNVAEERQAAANTPPAMTQPPKMAQARAGRSSSRPRSTALRAGGGTLLSSDPGFATSCVPPPTGPAISRTSSTGSATKKAEPSQPADHLKELFRGPCPPALPSHQNQSTVGEGSTPRKSARGKWAEEANHCARCKTKFFINLKLPCGRVVHLCPTCTSDFRTHLGKKINEMEAKIPNLKQDNWPQSPAHTGRRTSGILTKIKGFSGGRDPLTPDAADHSKMLKHLRRPPNSNTHIDAPIGMAPILSGKTTLTPDKVWRGSQAPQNSGNFSAQNSVGSAARGADGRLESRNGPQAKILQAGEVLEVRNLARDLREEVVMTASHDIEAGQALVGERRVKAHFDGKSNIENEHLLQMGEIRRTGHGNVYEELDLDAQYGSEPPSVTARARLQDALHLQEDREDLPRSSFARKRGKADVGGAAVAAVQEFQQLKRSSNMESRGQICGMSSPLSPHRTRQSAARVGREQRKEIAQHASALSAQARDKLGTPVTPMDRQFASLGKILGKISPLASPRAPQRGSLDTSHVDSGKSVGGTCRAAQPHHRAEKGGAGEGATPAKQKTKGGDISWKERHGGANGRGICGRGGLHGGMQEWGSVLLANWGIGEGGGSQAGSLSARRSVGAGIGNIEALPLSPKLLQAVNSPRQALAHPSPKALRMTPRFGVGMTDAKDLRDLRMDFSPQAVKVSVSHLSAQRTAYAGASGRSLP